MAGRYHFYYGELLLLQEEEMLEFSDSDEDDDNGNIIAELSERRKQLRGHGASDRGKPLTKNDGEITDPELSESELSDNALEEKEARMIQRRHAEQISEHDFDYEFAELTKAAEAPRRDKIEHMRQEDLSDLSEKQKWQLIRNTSPDLIPVINRCKALLPACSRALDTGASNDLRTNVGIDFCMNVGMYLILKILHEPDVHNHPITQRLVEYQVLMQQLERAEREAETYTATPKGKRRPGTQRTVVPTLSHTKELSANSSDEDEQDVVNETAEEEIRRRTVTDQILRNRGLTPHRKKELKNPRVKHRLKYRKAKIRRRGQIRPVRNELTAYAGEMSGIRAAVKRSVRLKA